MQTDSKNYAPFSKRYDGYTYNLENYRREKRPNQNFLRPPQDEEEEDSFNCWPEPCCPPLRDRVMIEECPWLDPAVSFKRYPCFYQDGKILGRWCHNIGPTTTPLSMVGNCEDINCLGLEQNQTGKNIHAAKGLCIQNARQGHKNEEFCPKLTAGNSPDRFLICQDPEPGVRDHDQGEYYCASANGTDNPFRFHQLSLQANPSCVPERYLEAEARNALRADPLCESSHQFENTGCCPILKGILEAKQPVPPPSPFAERWCKRNLLPYFSQPLDLPDISLDKYKDPVVLTDRDRPKCKFEFPASTPVGIRNLKRETLPYKVVKAKYEFDDDALQRGRLTEKLTEDVSPLCRGKFAGTILMPPPCPMFDTGAPKRTPCPTPPPRLRSALRKIRQPRQKSIGPCDECPPPGVGFKPQRTVTLAGEPTDYYYSKCQEAETVKRSVAKYIPETERTIIKKTN